MISTCNAPVTLVGHKDGAELRELVRAAAFVVLPSQWYDNSPMVAYEANALGKPVIASRIGGIPEIVSHEETGLLVEPRDPHQLADAMRRLHSEPELCIRLGRKGRERVEALCADHCESLMGIYEDVFCLSAQVPGT